MSRPGPLPPLRAADPPEPRRSGRPAVIACGLAEAALAEVRAAAGPTADVLAGNAEETRGWLAAREDAVLVLGEGLPPTAALALVHARPPLPEKPRPVSLALAAGDDLSPWSPYVAADVLFYLSRRAPPPGAIGPLVAAALAHAGAGRPESAGIDAREAETTGTILEAAERAVAQRDPHELAAVVAGAARDLAAADRAACLLHDPATDTLEARGQGREDRRESAASGLASWCLRTGGAVRVEALADDPRADLEADAPGAVGRERFLAAPVAGPDGRPRAVIVALRAPERPPFTAEEAGRLAALAWHVGPALHALAVEARLRGAAGAAASRDEELVYRPQALAHRARGLEDEGEVLDLSPSPVRWAYPLLLLTVAAGIAFGFTARVPETAAGPAFVRTAEGRPRVIALLPGRYRPLLAPGMPLRLDLEGFEDAAGRLTVAAVGEVAGPREVERLLGPRLSGAAPVTGTVVPVWADLPSPAFESGGRRYRYADGLPGAAQVPVRSERLLTSLFPGLRAFLKER